SSQENHSPLRLGAIADTDASDDQKHIRGGLALLNHGILETVDLPLIFEVAWRGLTLEEFPSLRLILNTNSSGCGYTSEQTSLLTKRRERSRNSSLA
ncbi:hypothetical protein CSPX01_05327, partial [Colletotrichum filicis]